MFWIKFHFGTDRYCFELTHDSYDLDGQSFIVKGNASGLVHGLEVQDRLSNPLGLSRFNSKLKK